MRVTLLDDYIMVCTMNQDVMPIYKFMLKAIKETTPVCHLWETADALQVGLPDHGIKWPDAAKCLWIPRGLVPGYHKFCVDVDYMDGDFAPWFSKNQWTLEGALVFQSGLGSFDVVPLVKETRSRSIIQHEVQLHYEYSISGWTWQRATTGPINPLFHDYFIDRIEPEDQEKVEQAVAHLGNLMNYCLGTYWQYLQQPGQWHIHAGKEAKAKYGKNGELKKIYKPATVGFKQYILN